MKKLYSLAIVLASTLAFGQISLTTSGTAYTENFDGMGPTGTTLPTAWVSTAPTVIVSNGSSNSGAIYNVGTTGATDRALGTLASNSLTPVFGASFTNNTGSAITSLAISYTAEQWRTGSSNTANEVVAFSYSTDATSLTTGTWTPVTALDLNEILTTTTSSVQVDGNLPANSASKNGTIPGLNIANGTTFWIKFTDDNAVGNDGMYAVDNFSLTPSGGTLAVIDAKNKKAGNFVKNSFVKNNEIVFGSDVKDVKVFNMSGQIVKEASVKQNETVSVAELSKGNYIVTGTVNNQPVSQKILKD
ncbi:T9SS type A sorting domain-containing protein [Chryseobacterium sp. 'Rf worker isolate 10']|uniref:T9SS type A sorting domain-containing protein n=1 Tax=Chryseobacterium sp. 'Rf worker isolate 10' TaxID=2887348 RepID=UPI003D6EE799